MFWMKYLMSHLFLKTSFKFKSGGGMQSFLVRAGVRQSERRREKGDTVEIRAFKGPQSSTSATMETRVEAILEST